MLRDDPFDKIPDPPWSPTGIEDDPFDKIPLPRPTIEETDPSDSAEGEERLRD